ncbi:MAG: sigma 54-interacting transcriptional regulator [Myxococcales bacterium]|nr:sigma 54-interacting transcriptional regulator [Myxococcales bacterium]
MNSTNPHEISHKARLQESAPAAQSGEHISQALASLLAQVADGAMMQALIDMVPNAAVFVVDQQRNILCWNDSAERLLGFKREEVLGRYCLTANRCHQCMLGCGISEYGSVSNVPMILLDAAGRQVSVRKTARAFFDDAGQFLGGVEVVVADDEASAPRYTPDLGDTVEFHGMISRNPLMQRAIAVLTNAARSHVPLLIGGAAGAGHEQAGNAVHLGSERAERPFEKFDCAALPPSLLAVELFGADGFAVTPGLFERVGDGTVLLSNVEALPLHLQDELAEFLRDGTFRRSGGGPLVSSEARVVASTERDPTAWADVFRPSLLAQLGTVSVTLPSLAERREDIEPLIWQLLEQRSGQHGRRVHRIAPETMRCLLDHDWPGNVRQLRQVIDYAFAVGNGSELAVTELPPEFRAPERAPLSAPVLRKLPSPRSLSADDLKTKVQEALNRADGHIGRAAELLGVSRPTLWRWRKQLGIDA